MVHLTVSDEYARLIAESQTPVIIVDPAGRRVGQVSPVNPEFASQASISAEELTEIKRRMANDDGTRFTLAEIMERVRALAPE